ncbi:unnamed protein product [Peniophora sp. CBMAI 1063]|nr:unnamed protein product [Peniophora sp. CBMAI 1063]
MFLDEPLPALINALEKNPGNAQLVELVDQELSRRSNHLRELQMCRNQLCSPIYKLPAELLSMIFLYYAYATQGLYTMSWKHLMCVSRRWNYVGRTTPKLWSYHSIAEYLFSFRGFRQLELQRKYTGNAPMNVKLRLSSSDRTHFLEKYKPFYWRPETLRSLELIGSPELLEGVLVAMAEHDHPLLEKLLIQSEALSDEQDTGGSTYARFEVPTELLCRPQISQQLKHLEVYHCRMRWACVRNLRTLRWVLVRRQPFELADLFKPDTIHDVAAALLRCPKLGALETTLPNPASHMLPEIPLPDLYDAELIGRHESCTQLLLAMKIPASAKLSVHAWELYTAREIRSLVLRMRLHFRRPGSETMRTLAIESFRPYQLDEPATPPALTVSLHPSAEGGSGYAYGNRSEETNLQLSTYPISFAEIRRMLVKLIHALPVDHITHVDARSVMTFTHRTWKMIILNLPALTTVSVRPSMSLEPLLSALHYFLHTKKRAPIQRIIIDNGYLTDSLSRNEDEEARERLEVRRPEARMVFGWLADYVTAAKEAGMPIAAIDIRDGYKEILGEIEAKDVFEHLTEGLYIEEVFMSREGTKKMKERRQYKQYSRRRWFNNSDSDSE